ncbi:MAG: hypothetical protein AUH29_00195 [Candidatus Rokubacteria bacterium 13_1_40CM_69_27]|nr:MAG: hypothetical protein AUH29_00195 [Candidatus Rokubacteria bacterium 13_1_40CM_69_27]OLC32619.1 MAG: hypothetical protein AUH81_15990 [Candidatus Rokubacteria bacterium 13_1_40CM_4_69_5]
MLHRAAPIAVSLAGLPFILPHVVEDFAEGIGPRVGLSTPTVAVLLGAFLALQSLGLVLLGQDRRSGWIITLGVGIIWTAGAVLDHGPEIVAGNFRSGAVSVLWVVGLVVSQAMTAALAWRGWRRSSHP